MEKCRIVNDMQMFYPKGGGGVPRRLTPVDRVKDRPADAPEASATDPVNGRAPGWDGIPGMVALRHRRQGPAIRGGRPGFTGDPADSSPNGAS